MAARKAEPGFTYEAIARAALNRDDVLTVPRLIRSFRKREMVLVGARGLSKRDMAALKDLWRGLVRVRLQEAPILNDASYDDAVALVDAVLDEVATLRRLIEGLKRCAGESRENVADAWLRRQLEGLGERGGH